VFNFFLAYLTSLSSCASLISLPPKTVVQHYGVYDIIGALISRNSILNATYTVNVAFSLQLQQLITIFTMPVDAIVYLNCLLATQTFLIFGKLP